MTEKLWEIIGEEFISYEGGYAILIGNGDCQFHVWETRKDAQKVCDKLNELNDEKNIAIEGIKIANDLIKRFGTDELKYEWKKKVKVILND